MARYRIVLYTSGTNINKVRQKVQEMFSEQEAAVNRVDPTVTRADRLADAESERDSALATVESLKEELQEWLDGMPENLKNGSKAEEIQEAITQLEEIESSLSGIDFSAVSFPGIH